MSSPARKTTDFARFRNEVASIMKARHGLDPNDYASDENVLMSAYGDGESALEYCERIAEKFDLERIDQFPTVMGASKRQAVHIVNTDAGPEPEFPDGIQEYGDKPKAPGLYIGFFHGRADKDASLQDWGHQGPLIGPVSYVQHTYEIRPHFEFVNAGDAERFIKAFPELKGDVNEGRIPDPIDGMIKIGGYYYGDWTIYYWPGKPKKKGR